MKPIRDCLGISTTINKNEKEQVKIKTKLRSNLLNSNVLLDLKGIEL